MRVMDTAQETNGTRDAVRASLTTTAENGNGRSLSDSDSYGQQQQQGRIVGNETEQVNGVGEDIYDHNDDEYVSGVGGVMNDARETLLAFAMVRSAPRFLIYSRFSTFLVRALEALFAFHALVMLVILFMLHVRFVKQDGCAHVLMPMVDELKRLPTWSEKAIVELQIGTSNTFRFARERGYLLLSELALRRIRQNQSVDVVHIDDTHTCLGPPISRWVLRRIVGYDTVAANAFSRLRKATKGPGYFLSLSSGRLLNLGYSDNDANQVEMLKPTSSWALIAFTKLGLTVVWKAGALLTATFIMCTTGALVDFALREVQVRLLKLTDDLQYVMRAQIPYSGVMLKYALDGLVFVPIVAGVLFFLFEFFDDQILAFLVMITAGMSHFALMLSTRHWISRECLPRLFFGYFLGFHMYFFSFPLGFSWCALATALAFMWHASLVVWNRCELPMIRQENRNATEWR